jgi:hypothetical protein
LNGAIKLLFNKIQNVLYKFSQIKWQVGSKEDGVSGRKIE